MEAEARISRQLRWVIVIAGVVAGAAFIFLSMFVLLSHNASAALDVRISPDRNNMLFTTYNNPLVNSRNPNDGTFTTNEIYHVLKNEGTSTVSSVELEAYYSEPSTAHFMQITDRVTGNTNRCGVQGTTNPHIIVTLYVDDPTATAPAGSTSVTYKIPYNNVCGTYAQGGNNTRGATNAHFFAKYPVPLAFANGYVNKDPETNLYRVRMVISYGPGVPTGTGGSTSQQVIFKVRTDTNGCATASPCQRYIGATAAPVTPTRPLGYDSARNISTLGLTNGNAGNTYVQEIYTFGLPCSVASAQSDMQLTVYDLDNGSSGNSWSKVARDANLNHARFYIQYDDGSGWQWFGKDDYISYTNATREQYGGKWTVRPDDGSSKITVVHFAMKPHVKYRIVITPLYTNNLFGIGLPRGTKTIYGAVSCDVSLDGAINTTPSTGVDPIEAGQTINVNAVGERGGNPGFTSLYHSNFRVWYDTGNGTYDAGETVKCLVDADRTQTGSANLGLGNCNNVVADPTQSGGAANAICAQLILTPNPADTLTQIGTGAAPDGITRCFHIGKYPHLVAKNGDVWAGGQFMSVSPTCSITTKPIVDSSQRQIPIGGAFYTSYATYGVTSLGTSTTFGSGGVSYDNSASTIADNLVFANTSSVDGYFYNATGDNGVPSQSRCLNDPFEVFGPRATHDVAGTSIDISSLTGDTNLTATSQMSLYASSPIPAGKKLVIYAKSADIRIASNITYADQAYGSINQIPQLVILTDRSIVVKWDALSGALSTGGKITQLDGIYAAKLNLYTCDLIPRLHLCDTPLEINGAVVVGGNTIPLRTAGAEAPDLGAMAETFNLRPDVLINQLPEAGSGNAFLKTMSETEVPPRF